MGDSRLIQILSFDCTILSSVPRSLLETLSSLVSNVGGKWCMEYQLLYCTFSFYIKATLWMNQTKSVAQWNQKNAELALTQKNRFLLPHFSLDNKPLLPLLLFCCLVCSSYQKMRQTWIGIEAFTFRHYIYHYKYCGIMSIPAAPFDICEWHLLSHLLLHLIAASRISPSLLDITLRANLIWHWEFTWYHIES